MYRFVLLLCISLSVQREPANIMEKCDRFLHPGGLACCTKSYSYNSNMEDLKECMQLPGKPPACEREICVGKKMGFASDDGTIDKKALTAIIEKDGKNDRELVTAILETCVEGDLSEFGAPDFCELIKLRNCMHNYLIVDCPEWKNDGNCSGAKEDAEKCLKELS